MMREVNNAMFSKKFDYNNYVSSIINNFKDETYPSGPFVSPTNSIMYGSPPAFGSPFGPPGQPMNVFPVFDPRYNNHFNSKHDPVFAHESVESNKARLHDVIKKAKQSVRNNDDHIKMKKMIPVKMIRSLVKPDQHMDPPSCCAVRVTCQKTAP